MQTAGRLVLAMVLVAAVAARLARPHASQAALATFGLHRSRGRWALLGVTAALEAVLAAGVALGSDAAAYAAAALLLAYAAALGITLMRGGAGAPCGCFGPRSRVSGLAVARDVALAAGFAVLPALPDGAGLSTDGWLAAGLGVALAAVAALAVAVLALAREIGTLRLRLAPERALEIAGEGPDPGTPTSLRAGDDRAQLVLAVFTSDGCPLCRDLEPAIRAFESDPVVSVALFDEVRDAHVWAELAIPGSPYAVVADRAGVVLAKGTFNSFGQLESVLATAERRMAEPALA